MPEKKTFNPASIDTMPDFGRTLFLYGEDGNDLPGAEDGLDIEDLNENYEVEITLTRKVKPIPDGTIVQRKAQADRTGTTYLKKGRAWFWLGSERHFPAARQDDDWYRENTTPLVFGSWDEVK